MKIPELGDMIVTRNGKRWICATSATILEKVGIDPDIHYADNPIKAYNVDEKSFNVWEGDETGSYSIESVIPAKKVRHQTPQKPRKHSELIKAWADGADVEWCNPVTKKWTPISGPTWREDAEYRIKTTRELMLHINSEGEIVSFGAGNLSLTFNNLGELISAEVIKK